MKAFYSRTRDVSHSARVVFGIEAFASDEESNQLL
jgi:hypothetical protein